MAIPKAGTTNSAVRVGVVPAAGGATQWISLPGDAREHYVARMEWAGNSDQLILQYLNRLQNDNQVMLADAKTGAARMLFEDKDPAWVDYVRSFEFVNGGKQVMWLGARGGGRLPGALAEAGSVQERHSFQAV